LPQKLENKRINLCINVSKHLNTDINKNLPDHQARNINLTTAFCKYFVVLIEIAWRRIFGEGFTLLERDFDKVGFCKYPVISKM